MSYYEILAGDAYGRFNRKLARLTTLEVAVYWSEILDIIPHVVKKQTYDDKGFFKLDRQYIEDRTCIQLEDQLMYDSILENMQVIERDPGDSTRILVKLEVMAAILADDNIKKLDLPKNKTKVSRTQAAANKKAAILQTMKKCVSESDEELRNKYESWVDSVYAAGKFLTKAKIQVFESAINTFTQDLKVKSDLLDLGIQTGWDNAEWIINKYKSPVVSSKPAATVIGTPQKVATSVSDKFEF